MRERNRENIDTFNGLKKYEDRAISWVFVQSYGEVPDFCETSRF